MSPSPESMGIAASAAPLTASCMSMSKPSVISLASARPPDLSKTPSSVERSLSALSRIGTFLGACGRRAALAVSSGLRLRV